MRVVSFHAGAFALLDDGIERTQRRVQVRNHRHTGHRRNLMRNLHGRGADEEAALTHLLGDGDEALTNCPIELADRGVVTGAWHQGRARRAA